MAKKISFQFSIFHLQLIIVFLFMLGCNSPVITDNQQVEKIELTGSPHEMLKKYKQQFEEATNDIDKLLALIEAAIVVEDVPEEKDTIAQQLADFTEKAPDCEIKISAYNTLSSLYRESDISLAFTYFRKALELIPKFPEYGEIMKADAQAKMAFIYSLYDDYEYSQQYILEAIPILEAQQEKDYQKIKEKTNISITNALLAVYSTAVSIYKFYGNKEKEEEYRHKLLLIAEKSSNPYNKASGYLGYAYGIVWSEPDKALEYIEKAYQIGIDKQNLAIIYKACDVFSCYEEAKENIPGAIAWLEKDMEYLQGQQCPFKEMNVYHNLAYLYELLPDGGEKHVELCYKGLALADSLEAKNFIANFHEMLRKYYAKQKNYKEAYVHQRKSITQTNKLKKEELERHLNFLTAHYDAERREMKIRNMEVKDKVRKIQLITGFSVCAVILSLLWYMLRLRTRRNRALAELNATKDKFLSIISHDLKNPALAQRDAIRLLVKNTDMWNKDELTNYCHNLLKSADEEVELLYSLLSWAQIQTEGISFSPITFDLPMHLRADISLIRNMAESKKITLTEYIPNHASVTGDINMLVTVIRNLLTNAVKFTPVGGQVFLTIETSANGKNTVTVSDTGIGMTPEEIGNLFCVDNLPSRKGTIGEQGTGLGLIICKELLKKHGTTLYIESEEGKGSRFWFEI